jgi:hypothetical protein
MTDTTPDPAPASLGLGSPPDAAPDLINILCIACIALITLASLAAAARGVQLGTIMAVGGSATAVFAAVINRGGQ